ncbi:double-strand break repair protein MRE11-like [Clytia hemisphaerica]|uniref:Double-strand break repair protein n=1 Tax=Clytia hemisphaerica TaxID=252671 RepID=A0A7M5XCI2_9CNID|eukprot:TCONS_00017900-protein
MATEVDGESVDESNVLKILLATDCHIGYAEKDPIRQNDSFVSFEEILQLAQKEKVDMILLGGDLFHENKPSRHTIHRTLSLLRKYCLGDKDCLLEFMSDAEVNFAHCDFKHANYLDPNLNVAYPLFSVHGNHDDPTGEGSLSAIDILSAAGVLNHFGKAENCDKIDMTPVLLKKGDTKLALYGLGSMRDERLYKTFCLKNVHMLRPREEPDSWFNIFVIHQNRAKHGPKNHIPESFLDEFLDLVVWGHEHECLITPVASESGKNFFVTQPGSSIATSLSEGESEQKKVGLLEISGKQFRIKEIELKTVRQFYIEHVVLSDTSLNSHEDEKVYNYLTEKIEQLITRAGNNRSGHEKQPELPLIRIKVEYSGGYEIINPHRFGQQFVGRVANSKDLLLFYKKKTYSATSRTKDETDGVGRGQEMTYSQASGIKMEDLINEYLTSDSNIGNLSILSERKLSKALNEFVLKDEKDAIPELVKYQLRKTQTELKRRNLVEEEKIDAEISVIKENEENMDEEQENEEIEKVLRESSMNKTNRVSNKDAFDEFDLDEEDDDIPSTKTTRGRGRGRGRGKTTSTRGTRGGRGRGSRGGRGGAKGSRKADKEELDITQKTIQSSFMSTATGRSKKNVVDLSMYDDDDIPSTKSFRSQRSKKVDYTYLDDDEDDQENPFDQINQPSKRARR